MTDLANPQTYSEWYWKSSIDAQKEFAEDSEKVLIPFISGILADLPLPEDTPQSLKDYITALSTPPSFSFLGTLVGVGVNAVDEVLDVMFDPIIKMMRRARQRSTKETWLTSSQVNNLWAKQKITEGLWNESTESEGYEDALASALYESELPYPSIPDVIIYSRYMGDYENTWTEFQKWWNINPREWPVWEFLSLIKLTTEQAQKLFVRGKMTEPDFMAEIGRIGYHRVDRDAIKDLSYMLPNPMLLIQAGLLNQQDIEAIIKDVQKADIHPDYSRKYFDAVLTKPATEDIIAYELRKDTSLSNLNNELLRIGIHPQYHDVYKELAYQIPPVQDIITMAVREAFTPEIAQRFGQYEDLPPQFVEFAGKKGLTKDWAERYWAAHWSLPSPQQGFEMLHRGIITVAELNLLLRALDIMPFWRDKLVQMSYRPLTRVDVRRMYQVGTLDESGVKKAYQAVGYSDINADLMTDFTIKYVQRSLSGFTSRDVINAYIKQLIDDSTARQLLARIGIRTGDIQDIINTSNYKKEWNLKLERIEAIENLYKKGRITESETRNQLDKLNLSVVHINTLLQQWLAKAEQARIATWTTAQTLKFLNAKLITEDRARQELTLLGYTPERINIYISSTQA